MSRAPLRVLFAAAEAAPLAKEGGLADVVEALARALCRLGVDARILIPGYGTAQDAVEDSGRDIRQVMHLDLPWGGEVRPVRIRQTVLIDRVPVLLAEEPRFFSGRGVYMDRKTDTYYTDNGERFLFFSLVVAAFLRRSRWRPDLVHLHDHHTGGVPVLHRHAPLPGIGGSRKRLPWVFTIHNIAYQGIEEPSILDPIGLDPSLGRKGSPLYWRGKINTMCAGIRSADIITTVSPTYAREIRTPEFGNGLDGVVRRRARSLRGILNGIDTRVWDPSTDEHIAAPYSAKDRSGKAKCRTALRRQMGFSGSGRGRGRVLVGAVSRLVEQKGWDLIEQVFPDALDLPLDLVVLGSGETRYQKMLRDLQERHPDRVRVRIGFDERLAHRIEAGADAFLMPSHFEPCGLNQMYSLRYGTLPVVRRTGGLADTVTDLDEHPDEGTGFVFEKATPKALLSALGRMCAAWNDEERWEHAVDRAMAQDHSWDRAAAEYQDVYESLL